MICLSTQNGTAQQHTPTERIREILVRITVYAAGTLHSSTSGESDIPPPRGLCLSEFQHLCLH